MNSLTTSPPNIIFECSDRRNDIGLMVTSKNNNNTVDNHNNEFQLHLYDGYNDVALVINIDINDFAKMFDSLSKYFQGAQIEVMNSSPLISSKSYLYDNERVIVTVTISHKNKINNNNNNNNIINKITKKLVIVTVTLLCLLSLRYIFLGYI